MFTAEEVKKIVEEAYREGYYDNRGGDRKEGDVNKDWRDSDSHAYLKSLKEDTTPTCPVCGKKMSQENYIGYYDSFSYWGCDCDHFPNGETWRGAYA